MRNYLLLTITLLLAGSAFGQVRGVSYTVAPSAAYNWFGNESGLDDAFMFGGRLGFGFGEYVELRATYMQTLDQNTDFAGLDLDIDSTFANQGVDLQRYGAELKLNIGRGTLLPYLLLGGGIQDTKREGLERAENIFGTLGLGLTLSAADRYTFGIEGKYIAYSGNTVRNLFDEVERQANNLDLDAFDSDQIGTYAVAANLQFYLGGRRPGQLSDIDQEYLRNFQGGLTGLSLPVEVGLAQMDWDDALPYRDAYFAGGTAGFSFGPLISLRGFYYRGMTDDEINFDFDDISLYGADVRFNLTQASSGLVPYLSIGGGYIDLSEGYNEGVTEIGDFASSQGFASGGGGIYLKFGERARLNGGVKAVLTTGADLEDVNSTEQITTSYMYTAGVGFTLGGNNRNNPDVVRQSTLEDRLESQQDAFERRADSIRTANQLEIVELRQRYQDSIAVLDQELIDALDAGDLETAEEIQLERENATAVVAELETRQDQLTVRSLEADAQRDARERAEIDAALGRPIQPIPSSSAATTYPNSSNGSVIVLQAEQIDRLIDAIGNRGGNTGQMNQGQQPMVQNDQLDQINRRIERMEDMLFQLNTGGAAPRRMDYSDRAPRSDEERIEQLEQRLERLRDQGGDMEGMTSEQQRMQELEREIEDLRSERGTTGTGLRLSDSTRTDSRTVITDRRIQDLERELEEARRNGMDRNTGSVDDERMEELERRMTERINSLREDRDPSETEELRTEMIRDLTDYQSEMMEEIRDLQRDLDRANRELARREAEQNAIDERMDLERDKLRQERRLARQEAATKTTVDSLGNRVIVPGTRTLEEISVNTGGVYLADDNAEGFFSNFTYTGMSGTAGFNFGDATGLGLGVRWHYKLGPDQRAEFMPEAYFGIGSPTTFGLFANIIYPLITDEAREIGFIPYAGIGVGAMQIKDDENSDELNFRPALNIVVGSYLPVGNGRFFADFSTRNFFSVNQLTGGYRFNF
ncbi:hypothetical protein LEM8419_03369 [Neolewinella maritima]|uniref:Outer membrane protein beta-barrel domain-containing protein n=1 Tax=Neolewinella maritima TaxID=1383882 RepID=A0ABM9B6A2_9BACT|nr:hypothetical protein [Neolewinella maritima]CAH1002490.1 hypothetical protein LEM8419_03369 [Neolewinella maritima]